MLDPVALATNDELDLIACCLNGWSPADVDVTPDDFDEPKHTDTWRAMLSIANSGNKPNPASTRLALGAAGDKAAVWLMDVFSRPIVPANAPALAERVRRAAHLRDLQELSRRIMQESTLDDADPAVIAEKVRRAVDKAYGVTRTTETFNDSLGRVVDQLQTGIAPGLSTPWVDLNRKIHGLAKDRLYIVAARPGVGKSLLGQNLAWHWSHHHGLPVFFASLEMSTDELTTRSLAAASGVELNSMLSASVTPPEWDKIERATPKMLAAKIHVCDDPGQSLDTIRSGARDLQRRHGLGLIVVDYLQLVTPRDRRAPREQQVAEISRSLKLLAKELHVPVVAMSQVRRLSDGEKNRPPSMSDLRESGAIEQDADVVMILHIADPINEPQWADLLVAKARAGERGAITLQMRTSIATIETPINSRGVA